jgi:ATP-dependent DNA helicase RecG
MINQIINLISAGESETLEFKKTFRKEAVISLSAMANTMGGWVIIGVDDDGNIIGFEGGKEKTQQMLNEIKLCTYPQIVPAVRHFTLQGKNILGFLISEYPVKPVSCKGRYFKRVENSNHQLSLDEIVSMRDNSLNISFDSQPQDYPLSSLDMNCIEQFLDKIKKRGRVSLGDDLATNLAKLQLIKNGKPCLAATLLFGESNYAVKIGRFKSPDTIIDEIQVKAPLISGLEEVMIFIKKHINLSYEFDGSLERKERWQYPLAALRELRLNAVMHRDYRLSSDIVIKIFDHSLIITSPGRIFGNLKLSELERNDYTSSIRNKILADALYLAGEVETYGTGLIRVRNMLKRDTRMVLEEKGDFFVVRLEKTTQKKSEGLSEGLNRLLECIRSMPGSQTPQLAKQLNIPAKTIERWIRELKQKGAIEYRGSKKTGGYYVA